MQSDKELEYSKCIALLRKAFRLKLISESEYALIKNKLMDKYIIIVEQRQ